MTSTENWYRVIDSKDITTLMRGDDYEDAAQQVLTIRRREGQYREVPEYDQLLLLIGGPLNPVRIELFELVNQGNGMAIDSFQVILDSDALASEQKRSQEAMERQQFHSGHSGRFG